MSPLWVWLLTLVPWAAFTVHIGAPVWVSVTALVLQIIGLILMVGEDRWWRLGD